MTDCTFHKKHFDCNFSQNSKIYCPVAEVEDSGSSDKPNYFTHSFNDLHEIRFKNPNRLIFAHINLNSLRKKFEMSQEVIGNKIHVLLLSETKLNASFLSCPFILDGFTSPYRLDKHNMEKV